MVKFNFNDLLPHSIKDDPKIKAASQCLDTLFEKHNDRVKNQLIYSRIDELDEQTLDDIAWQWNLNYDNGYSLLETIEEKRELVKSALQLHKYLGTRWSIERAGKILNMPIEIIEWWETKYETTLQPGEFDVFVDANQRGVSDKFYSDVINLINSLKNARSHLRRIQAIISINANLFIGSACILGGITRVISEIPKEIEIKMDKYIGLASQQAIVSYVYPDKSVNTQIKVNKRIGAIFYSAYTTSVFPDMSSEVPPQQ